MPVAVFCMFFTSQEIDTKWSPNATKLFVDFYGPEDIQWAKEAPGGALRGAQPARARLEAQERPGGLCPPRWPPALPLCSINTPIFQNPTGVDEKQFQPPQVPETTYQSRHHHIWVHHAH